MPAIPDSHRDLLDAQVATLATVGPDGRPQLSEVWFLADDGTVRISLSTSRQKSKNLRRNPVCTLLVLDLDNPQRYLEIRADARIAADDGYAFADRVGAKYGADLRAYDQPGESRIVVELVPVRVNAVDMSG
jgi:PPOX class probable F420-dependent enzyme